MPLDPLLKTLHVLGAIVFVGNVIVTGLWAAIFWRARATHDFRRAARAIVLTDWAFTVGGGALLTTSGVLLALRRGLPLWGTPWIRDALVALAVSTLVWLLLLVPAQRTLQHTTEPATQSRAFHRWNVAGWSATVPLLYAVARMVWK
jgi:uncharacterized membrane protein